MLVALAIATHIPVSEWLNEDDQTIATALTILAEAQEATKSR